MCGSWSRAQPCLNRPFTDADSASTRISEEQYGGSGFRCVSTYPMNQLPTAFVMEQALGHVTHARNLSATLRDRDGIASARCVRLPYAGDRVVLGRADATTAYADLARCDADQLRHGRPVLRPPP